MDKLLNNVTKKYAELSVGIYRMLIQCCNNDVIELQPCWVGLVVRVSASHTIGHGFASRPGHTKDHHKNGTNCLPA